MIDPIHNSNHKPIDWAWWTSDKEDLDLHGAEEEVASLYYQTTLSSMAPTNSKTSLNEQKIETIETKSILTRAKDWFWNLIGWGEAQPVPESEEEESIEDGTDDNPLSGGPKLPEPQSDHQRRLTKQISEHNRELSNRLKEIAEFEEEMRKSSTNIDKSIFMYLVESNLRQKDLSHSRSLIAHEDLMALHKKNKELHKLQFGLIDSINDKNATKGILKWIKGGLTGFTVGGMAIIFASGGSAIAALMPIALLAKSPIMLFEGILKYQSDNKTGEMIVLKQEIKTNSANEREYLTEMQNLDADITKLLKKIREILDNQTKAERASFGKN